jgi:hypothetical protein
MTPDDIATFAGRRTLRSAEGTLDESACDIGGGGSSDSTGALAWFAPDLGKNQGFKLISAAKGKAFASSMMGANPKTASLPSFRERQIMDCVLSLEAMVSSGGKRTNLRFHRRTGWGNFRKNRYNRQTFPVLPEFSDSTGSDAIAARCWDMCVSKTAPHLRKRFGQRLIEIVAQIFKGFQTDR